MVDRHQKNGKRIVLSESAYGKIAGYLSEFLRRSRASLCIFADINGYPISHRGQDQDLNIQLLTALAAGDFSATMEIATLMGEKGRFKFIYHEGEARNLYLCNVGKDYILIVLFDQDVPLGLIRVLTQRTLEKLHDLFIEVKTDTEQAAQFLDLEFRKLVSEELDKTFR